MILTDDAAILIIQEQGMYYVKVKQIKTFLHNIEIFLQNNGTYGNNLNPICQTET